MPQKKPFIGFLRNSCSKKFHKILKKIRVMESFFNKIGGRACNVTKKEFHEKCFPKNLVKCYRTLRGDCFCNI